MSGLEYVQQGVVSRTDPYVIAINGAGVHPIFGEGAVVPSIVRAVMPLGQLRLVFADDVSGEPYRHIEYRPVIEKKSGSKVRTDAFLNGTYAGVSGVLFSRCELMMPLQHLGLDFVFVHNRTATNPLPHGWLKMGREYWLTENMLHVECWSSGRED